jgi:N utilization substance protein B
MTKRSLARETALQLLFQVDLNPAVSREDIIAHARQHLQLGEEEVPTFTLSLYDGTRRHQPAIDEILARAAENWSLHRLEVIDRNILRLATYELLHTPDTPAAVVFNEAIELARRFGSAESPAFVNGVLDRVRREAASATPEAST